MALLKLDSAMYVVKKGDGVDVNESRVLAITLRMLVCTYIDVLVDARFTSA